MVFDIGRELDRFQGRSFGHGWIHVPQSPSQVTAVRRRWQMANQFRGSPVESHPCPKCINPINARGASTGCLVIFENVYEHQSLPESGLFDKHVHKSQSFGGAEALAF